MTQPPSNQSVAELLREIGKYLAMQEVPFKPRAYEKAADTINELENDVYTTYQQGGMKALKEIPGVGASIAETIEEFIKTGKVKYHEQLKKKTPVDLSELSRVEGLGPKSIQKLYQKLHVRSLAELERVGQKGKIGKLEGFGAKSEEKILKSIGFAKKSGGRVILGHIMPRIREIEARLTALPGVEKA